jgi:tetratricopeptide (TPR) repeat protein
MADRSLLKKFQAGSIFRFTDSGEPFENGNGGECPASVCRPSAQPESTGHLKARGHLGTMDQRQDGAVPASDVWSDRNRSEPEVASLMSQARKFYFSKEYVKAAEIVGQAIALAPEDPDLWNTRGVFLRAGARSAEAVWNYRQGLARQPGNAGFWSNLGNALTDLKQLETAAACHSHAIALQPGNAEFHRNLAHALIIARRHREALEALSHALHIAPDNISARFDRSMAYLHLGEYARGWADYEVRHQNSMRALPGRTWRGQPYPGRRLVIISEQGHGDAIWSARYFRRAKALGGELVVECHEGLVPLFSAMPEIDSVVAYGNPVPPADYHCYVCSLAGIFTPDMATIPSAPYISTPRDRVEKFAAPMARAGGAVRVGIIWSGNLSFGRNKDRAAPLRAFMQAFAHPGVQLYSLQKGPLEKDLLTLSKDAPIIDLAPLLDDFADAAAAVAELDLVIMTDSAVAHLCGAMGRPVWVLLSYEAFWLWLLDRNDSPWYPSMRFFRQQAWGDWGGVFDAASAALLRLALARG